MISVKLNAVVDRIVGNVAVLLVGPDETKVDFPISCLPKVHEGAILSLEIGLDEDEEKRRQEAARNLLDELLEK